jgi:hypothetical protein
MISRYSNILSYTHTIFLPKNTYDQFDHQLDSPQTISSISTMADPAQTSSVRRCSTDPVYLSSHFLPHPHPPFRPRAPAVFHKTSLQARNYLTPPSSSASSSPTDSDGTATPLSGESADDSASHADSPFIPAQVSTRIESWHQRRPSFEPLWEESDTFSPSKVSEFRDLGRSVNALAETARKLCSGGRSAMAPGDDQHQTIDQGIDGKQEASRGRRKGSGCFRVSLSPVCFCLLPRSVFAIVVVVALRDKSLRIGAIGHLYRREHCLGGQLL